MTEKLEKSFTKKNEHKADISSSNDKSSTFEYKVDFKDYIKDDDVLKIVKSNHSHIVDLCSTPRKCFCENLPLFLSPPKNYLYYFVQVVKHLFFTLIFDWTLFITHPVNFILTFVIFPLVAIMLFFLEIILSFISYLNLDNYNHKTVLESWSKLIPLSQLLHNLRSGMKSLDQNSSPTKSQPHQGFNLDRTQFLLYLSSLMYDRNEKQVIQAHRILSKMKKDGNNPNEKDLQKAYKLLKESEKKIRDQIKEFNLQFTSLSELNTLGGPYVGMFWSEENNFIIIVCKGTTPTNFNEWLTNASFQRMDARPFLFGEVHQGFYSLLFPDNEYESAKFAGNCPATRIIEAVRRKGEEIRIQKMKNSNKSLENTPLVNVYVTGHSLGAALANLVYGRLLKSPQSLGEHCILRDGTTFASPSIGDSDFAAEFSSLCNKSVEEYKTLWRIVCDNDIVPRVPPGHQNPNIGRYTKKIHIMNYFHVGEEIRFYQDGSQPSSMRDIFGNNKETIFVDNILKFDELKCLFGFYDPFDNQKKSQKFSYDARYDGMLIPIERFLLPLVRNHMTHRYLVALEKSRNYFNTNNVTKS